MISVTAEQLAKDSNMPSDSLKNTASKRATSFIIKALPNEDSKPEKYLKSMPRTFALKEIFTGKVLFDEIEQHIPPHLRFTKDPNKKTLNHKKVLFLMLLKQILQSFKNPVK
jgi:hypothetical protein